MSPISRKLAFLLGLMLLFAGAAFAAETGSLSGTVRSADGAPLPGVRVTVAGPLLPAGRSGVTGADGTFDFQRLPPGTYQVSAALEGTGTARREAIVALDKDTQLALVLKPTLEEAITVSAAAPVIDLKSAEVEVNFTAPAIEALPLPRTYKGLFQLAPGVADNQRLAPNAGGSRLDNTYLLDGINVTNPDFGDIVPDFNGQDVLEVNLKRAGITAEFGRTGGMVVNAITKSGTNRFAGELRFEDQPASLVSGNKNTVVQNTTDKNILSASLGGPIVRDRLWFFGSASLPRQTTTDRRNNLGAVPDSSLDTDEYFGKISANPFENHLLAASWRTRKTTNGNANITSTSAPSVGTNDSTKYRLGTFGWTWNTTASSFAEVKANHDEEDNSTDPLTHLGYRPAFNAARPDLVGRFITTKDILVGGANNVGQTVGGSDLAVNNQDYTRDEVRADFRSLHEWGKTDHDLRLGGSYERDSERLERQANGWGNVTWNPDPKVRQFTASYVSAQPPHTGRGRTYGLFLQDQAILSDRLTVTAGVLVDHDDYYGEALGATPGTKVKKRILTFDFSQEIQPRLGVVWLPRRERGDKLYASFGRYYNTDNKSLGRAASPTRIFTTRAIFDANGNLISEVPAANTQSKTIDPGIDPQYTDEYVAGYALPLPAGWAAELWGMYRNTGNILEDVSRDGLGNGPFHVSQLPDAYRRYEAVTLEVNRLPLSDRWLRLAVNASYTWSRLYGNWDIDFGGDSPFYNSSFIQDGPGVKITDNRNGLLRGDRTHVAKLFASIEPRPRLRAGTFLRFQSGGAWEARGLPDPNVSSSSFVRYLEPAGSRRMPSWFNVDLLASYEVPLSRIGLELEARLLNVFNTQVPIQVDDRLILGRGTVPDNPNFGKGTVFTPPRALVLAARVRY
jgi:carboxypeptidase family protein/TonB-dependent receptor-like protein